MYYHSYLRRFLSTEENKINIYTLSAMLLLKRILLFLMLPLSFAASGQISLGTVATTDASCTFSTTVCANEIVHLTPQNVTDYINFHWYSSSVSPANEITAATAASFNVDPTNFATNFPTINVVNSGGTYILTAEYATPTGCATKNDIFMINYNPLPTLTINSVICQQPLTKLKYDVTFTASSGTSISTTAGTVSGNSIIDIPAGTNITITATSAAGCVATFPVTAPNCACQITASWIQNACNGNGTQAIAGDDYFTVTVTASSANGGASGKYEVVLNNTVLNTGGTTYGQPVTVGGAGVFASDGASTYTLTVRDLDTYSCVSQVFTTKISASCSTLGCPPNVICVPVQALRQKK